MNSWWFVVIIGMGILALAGAAFLVWRRGPTPNAGEAATYLRELGIELIRLPGRLRRLAADPRTPRRARWVLIALAIYVASPIDPIPDFLPMICHLDELIVVPLVLTYVRRIIPPEVWAEHFGVRSQESGVRSDE
jgi:uncharacterized membrane protein YkvA (DUF1232 family)